MRPALAVDTLSSAFRAFVDLHRPGYLAYAVARVGRQEAALAVTHTFTLMAADWTTAMNHRSPAAYAWRLHTRYISAITGTVRSQGEDIALLHHQLHLTIDRIATLTGCEPATVIALLAGRTTAPTPRTGQPHPEGYG